MSPRERVRVDRRVGLLLGGVILLLFVALGASVALPASDPLVRDEGEDARAYGELEERGARIYQAEGCWYCHTQQVRRTPADAGLGEPLSPGDYVNDQPAMLGVERLGPDLTHVGGRYEDTEALIRILRDPRGDGRRSSMPSYAFLSSGDLEALSAYLLSLR